MMLQSITSDRTFYLPLFLLIITVTLFELAQYDLVIADQLFLQLDQKWLRHHWLLEGVIHKGGRIVAQLALLVLIVSWMASFWIKRLQPLRLGLSYLLCAICFSVISVALGKQLSQVDCPWNLSQYAGALPYHPIFSSRPDSLPAAACFPAGHASAGYCWVAVYFLARQYRPAWRVYALIFAISLGLIFGISQQLRGAHFLSHDVWTLMICWFWAGMLYHLLPILRLKVNDNKRRQLIIS